MRPLGNTLPLAFGTHRRRRPSHLLHNGVHPRSHAPRKWHAGKDGSYAFFTGVDASRAFLTGDFAGDLNDNITDFTDSQMAGLSRWKDFYHKVRRLSSCDICFLNDRCYTVAAVARRLSE